jgi:hypothetical protein
VEVAELGFGCGFFENCLIFNNLLADKECLFLRTCLSPEAGMRIALFWIKKNSLP